MKKSLDIYGQGFICINDMSKAWRKWCNSHEYRRREWLWRQNLAAAHKEIYTNHTKNILI